ncbi:MAG: MBL fold metallo-hydrolase [Candidatus Kerfeldbacteria bacterium]|nr:MBL fold metallo-hydrolase [Candidatus Kerfeldbacteria bacterium]
MRSKLTWLKPIGVLAVAGVVLTSWLGRPPESLRLVVLDVGQGDAILIRTPSGSDILIDGGPDGSVVPALERHLPPADRTLELVVLTHPDLDHVGGLPDVAKHFQIERVIETRRRSQSQADRRWEAALAEQGSQVIDVAAGDRLTVDEVQFDVLWPEAGRSLESMPTNDTSVVMLVTYQDDTLLLTGDIGLDVEDRLLQTGGLEAVDVIKVPHHGSISSSSAEFLSALRPTTALISVGSGNAFGHPHPVVLRRYEQHEARVFRTDLAGDVVCESRGQGFSCIP